MAFSNSAKTIKKSVWIIVLAWTMLLSASAWWNLSQVDRIIVESALVQARSNITKDVVYRRWNAMHGGVYVPVSAWTQPNPHLIDTPERDITTPSGIKLTRVNPAYMARQAFELGRAEYGLHAHITSLNPIRPENAPDAWETEALKAFEAGAADAHALENLDAQPYLRLMQPLVMEQSCIKCHAHQGFKLNDIRGGISVGVPMQPFMSIASDRKLHLALVHGFLWLSGLSAIVFGATHLGRCRHKQLRAEGDLQQAYADLERKVAARTAELSAANQALQESTLQLRLAVNAANVGLWDWDLSTNKVFFSAEWKRQIGYEPHEITDAYEEWESRLHADDRPLALQAVRAAVENPQSEYHAEFRLRHKDGSYRWIMTQGSVICADAGRPVRMLGSHVDITEHKKAEEELRRSQTHLAAAQRVAKLGSWQLDLSNGTGTWSEEMFRILDLDAAQGTPSLAVFIEHVHPEDRPLQTAMHEQIVKTGEAVEFEFRSNPQKGPLKYFLAKAEAMRDDQGNIASLVGTLQDITDRKLVLEALEAERRKFQALIDESPYAVALVGPDQRFRYLNPGFKKIFGYTMQDIPTRFEWFEKAYPDPAYRAKIMESWRQAEERANPGMIRNQIWTVQCKNGAEKIVQISTAFLSTGDKIITYEDVTEHLNLEDKLRQAQKMEAIGTLAGGIAHDFNNILTAILGYADLVKVDAPADGPTGIYIGEVIKAGMRAKNLVQHILAFSRQNKPEKAPLAIHLVVKEALSLIRATIPTSIEIQQEIASSGMIMGDSNQMHQVVMNLCTNAFQAMRVKGGVLKVQVKPVLLEPGDATQYPDLTPGHYVLLSVSDTGCGMTPDIIRRIFDPYFTTKPPGEGTGLGLSVIHGIVKSHGGTINVYSEPNQGSIFHVYLPLLESDEKLAETDVEQPLPMGTEHILFVDDEPVLVELGKKMLAMAGYQVVTRANGYEALEMIRENPDAFDLLITDMTMPHLTGVELAAEVLRLRPDLPIILCTGFSHNITSAKAQEMGIREMIMKPLIRKDLTVLARKVLDESRPNHDRSPKPASEVI